LDFAVVVGVEDYPDFQSLRGVHNDAKGFYEWLLDRNGGGLDKNHVKLILSDAKTKTPVQDEIDLALVKVLDAAEACGGARRLYFYFGGHGATNYPQTGDDVALLLTRWSTQLARLALSTQLYSSKLRGTGLFEELVIFLDCCRTTSVAAIGVEPAFAVGWQKGPHATQTFIGYATEDGRPAFEVCKSDKWEGIFTKCLLSTLRSRSGVLAVELMELVSKEMAKTRPRNGVPQVACAVGQVDTKIRFGRIGATVEDPYLEIRFAVPCRRVVLRGGKLVNGEFPIVIEHAIDETLVWRVQLPIGLYELEAEGRQPICFRHHGQGRPHEF
jgi:hypothetical protein